MAIIQGNAKQGSTRGFYPKIINGSLRFNDDDSAYLSWTPASAGNRKTWTWSGWVKRGNLSGVIQGIFDGSSSSQVKTFIRFTSSNTLEIGSYNAGFQSQLITTQVFRDPSAWYHIVVAVDTTQATSSNRVKLYVNGQQITAFGTETYPSQNFDTYVNATSTHTLGSEVWTSIQEFLDGYLANVHFIDGQALTADDFGETKNGVWVAKDYAGTFGTNGFYLTFEDDTQVEAFNTVLYRGATTGTESQIVTGTGFTPDLVWIKNRGTTNSHRLFDSVRGTGNYLETSGTSAEASDTGNGTLTSFDSDGFTLQGGSTNANPLCESGNNYVAWGWKAGDSNVSNTDGTITSTVRANDTYGFSIVSYTGNGTDGATVGHGLGQAPDFIIIKNRDDSTAAFWCVYHSSLFNSSSDPNVVYLNSTQAATDDTNVWGVVDPQFTSDIFTIGSYNGSNGSTDDHIAYCWTETTGYSKFGSYDGDSTTDGSHEINVGFKPAMVIIKHATGAYNGDWFLYDNTRDVPNGDSYLRPNLSSAETANGGMLQLTDTGFAFYTNSGSHNQSGFGYIYAAFADTREAAFWLDQSGNDNDWQPVNLDHNDTVVDSPTNNFATLNPLTGGSSTTSNGNLEATIAPINGARVSTFAVNSGKWYCEMTPTTIAGYFVVGIGAPYSKGWNTSQEANAKSIVWASATGTLINTGSWSFSSSTVLTTYTTNDVLGIALDMDSNTIEFFKNGSSVGSATISVDQDVSFLIGNSSGTSNGAGSVNFGQLGFTYTPPTGFNALSTANLPDPVIDPAQGASPEDYFGTLLWSGDDNATRTIQAGGSGVTGDINFTPDFAWIKRRNGATNGSDHMLLDSVRGVGSFNALSSNGTQAEGLTAAGSNWINFGDIDAFTTDGFTVQKGGDVSHTLEGINQSGGTYVGWNWKANGSGVSNTDGSITSTVSANTTSGFSIVSFTGDGSSSATVGHGLDTAPDMIIVKARSTTENWYVYHSSMGLSKFLRLDTTDAQGTATNLYSTVNSTVFNPTYTGTSGITNIAYCFHSVEGFSKFGSYVGNGSADGPFVYTGFRPAFVMIKRTDASGNSWVIHDNERDSFNLAQKQLLANSSNAETDTTVTSRDFLSNGFKLRGTNTGVNGSGATYIYMAFAENPFKYSNAR